MLNVAILKKIFILLALILILKIVFRDDFKDWVQSFRQDFGRTSEGRRR